MTVGIAAACAPTEGNNHVIVVADRMITSGMVTRIEYEHTRSKLTRVFDDPNASIEGVHCMAVSAGAVSYADKFFTKLNNRLSDTEPAGVEHIATIGANVLQEMVRERGNKQVLNQFGITLGDIRNGNVSMSDNIITQLLSEASDEKAHILENFDVLFAGIDHTGTGIYSIPDGNVAPHNQIGYQAVGSGAQPARSSFIRNRYDVDCELEESLLASVEAKIQSEEAQGVGSKMDVAVINNEEGCYVLSNDEDVDEDATSEVGELVELYENVVVAEKEARDNILNTSEYTFTHSDEN